jgi:hypothetical protein
MKRQDVYFSYNRQVGFNIGTLYIHILVVGEVWVLITHFTAEKFYKKRERHVQSFGKKLLPLGEWQKIN